MAQASSIHLNTRLSFFIVGGTVIAIVIGGTALIRDMPSYSFASYLVSKLSSFIPWRTATAVDTKRLEGIELGERDGNNAIDAELNALRKELAEAREREERRAGIEKELNTLRNEVTLLKKQLEESRAEQKDVEALELTIQELHAKEAARIDKSTVADVYARASDNVPQVDVVKLVEALNNEIQEVAALIVRSFGSSSAFRQRPPSEEPSEELQEAIAGVAEIMGARMVELLQSPQRAPIQMALQASTAAYTHWVISSWYFESPEDEHLLSEIYARVRETEEQAISGRWRALTRTHLQRMLSSELDLSIYLVHAFVNILFIAGWHTDTGVLQDYIISNFSERIDHVIKLAQNLNKAIGEGVTSCDLEALYIAPDVLYNAETMEEQRQREDHHVQSRVERVLCTTELGLVKAKKKVGKVGEWDEAVLLKPTVVLQSSFGTNGSAGGSGVSGA